MCVYVCVCVCVCHSHDMAMRETYIECLKIEHRNLETRKNTYEFFVQV